jgi:hypothetical protein
MRRIEVAEQHLIRHEGGAVTRANLDPAQADAEAKGGGAGIADTHLQSLG